MQFDFLRFDTGDLMIHRERAGLEIPIHYRHRDTGMQLETKIVNFWTFEDGGRSGSRNITISAASRPSARVSPP